MAWVFISESLVPSAPWESCGLMENETQRIFSILTIDIYTICQLLLGEVSLSQDKLSKLQPPEKPQLYIGGIFPITGTKYKAPELAAGFYLFILILYLSYIFYPNTLSIIYFLS